MMVPPLPAPIVRRRRTSRSAYIGRLLVFVVVMIIIAILAITIYFALRGQFPIGDPVLPTQMIIPSATITNTPQPTATITETPVPTLTSTISITAIITSRPTDQGIGGGGDEEDPTPTQEILVLTNTPVRPQATNATLIPSTTPTTTVLGWTPVPAATSTQIIYPTFAPTTFVPTAIPTVFVATQRAIWDWRNSKDGANCNIGSNINNSTSGQIFFTNTRSSTVYLVEMDLSGAVIAKEIQQPLEPGAFLPFYEPLGKNYAVTSDPQGTQKLMFNVTDSNNEPMGSYCIVGIHPDYPANANINVIIP